MAPKKRISGNGGMTLIELLLAMLILAIICVPLLHAFTTSASTTRKSQNLGDATLAARNVTESVEALLIRDLAAKMGGGGSIMNAELKNPASDADLPASPEAAEDHINGASYSFELHGIESGKNSYDALVTLDASAYSERNDAEVTQYTPMDAVFSQPGGQYENPDSLTYEDFASQATAFSGAAHTADEFFGSAKRVIDIYLTETDGMLTATTSFTYTCDFTFTQTITGADGRTTTETSTEELSRLYAYEFYREKVTGDSASGLTSIYFFYYPNYNYRGSDQYNDYITIHNEGDVEFSLFLIKQKALSYGSVPVNGVFPTLSDSAISPLEATYRADVALMESANVASPVAVLYSNINQDITGKTPSLGDSRMVRFRAFRGSHWYVDGYIKSKLVATSRENRFYELTVSVYAEGDLSGRTAGAEISASPIYTLTSSKLD